MLVGGFGNGEAAFQLAHSDLCLNIAENSRSVGAWVILWPCTFPSNEMFYVGRSGLNDNSFDLISVSSGLCVDLSAGWHTGSILVQKTCIQGDPWQAWFLATS
jgi:Ricin-type beta-trefoil lectin domain